MKCLFFSSLCLLCLISCSNDDDRHPYTPGIGLCDQGTVISEDQFDNMPSDEVMIMSAIIEGDCLIISYASSGCDGRSWEVRLIDADVIMESSPPQRNVRLALDNNEACLAFISTETSFDISNLQVDNSDSVRLNIQGAEIQVLYSY